MHKFILTFCAFALWLPIHAATSLTQYGITWTWVEDLTTGTFANGDYYVVAPSGLTLTGITGTNDDSTVRGSVSITTAYASNFICNGSMANPIPDDYVNQGLDGRLLNYTEANNIARSGGNPLSGGNTRSIAAGTSIVSVSSFLGGVTDKEMSWDHAVLTVLASAPAAGSFRPSPYGTDKTIHWNKSDLDYTILRNLTPVTGQSSPTSAQFTRPWLHVSLGYLESWTQSPRNNQPAYDRDMGYAIQNAMLELHQNYSDATKELAYVRLVQAGIDIYGALKYGHFNTSYPAMSGNYCFHSLVVLAGLALDDADIKYYANDGNRITNPYIPGTPSRFNEDIITSYVTSGMVNDTVPDGFMRDDRPRYTYTAQMLGMPEWGAENGAIPSTLGAGSNVGVTYRDVRYPGIVGAALAMQLTTGAVALWNHQAFFDYHDRARAFYAGTGGDDPTPATVSLVWAASRSLGGTIWTGTPISGVAWIPPTGDRMIIEYTDHVTTGAGGNGGVTITASGGAVTATYTTSLLPTIDDGSTLPLRGWQRVYSLSRIIGAGEQNITYSFTQPGNGVEALVGGADVASVTNAPVVNYVGATVGVDGDGGGGRAAVPLLSSATIPTGGTTLSLVLTESCTTGSGGSGGVTLSASGGAVTATYSSGSGSTTYVYSLSRTVLTGETVTVSYTQPGSGIEATDDQTDLASFSNQAVTNSSTQSASYAPAHSRRNPAAIGAGLF